MSNRIISAIGEGEEAFTLLIGVPVGILALISLPFMLISKCSEDEPEKEKPKMEEVQQAEEVKEKPSLSRRAGKKAKESVIDFTKGLFD